MEFAKLLIVSLEVMRQGGGAHAQRVTDAPSDTLSAPADYLREAISEPEQITLPAAFNLLSLPLTLLLHCYSFIYFCYLSAAFGFSPTMFLSDSLFPLLKVMDYG